MELDSGTLTHVAAVLVGVVVTAIVAQLLSGGSSSKTVEEAPAAAGGGGKKKKKKKKAKATEEEASETTKQAPKAAEPTASSGKKKKKTNGNNSNSDAADKENAAENGAANGKNGKKKKKEKQQQTTTTTTRQHRVVVLLSSSEKTDFQKANAPAPAPVYVAPDSSIATAAAAATSAPTSLTETLSIDAKKVGIIIGPKGTTMEAIKVATGCSLEINAPAGSEDNKKPLPPGAKAGVIIQGSTKEDILKAKKAVQELAAKGYATLLQGDNFGETGIEVHPRFLSEIVGPSGRTIQALQKTLDVKITIPPTDWKPNAPQVVVGVVKPCRVGIAGSKENARKCKESIQNIMQYHYDAVSHPGVIHEEVYVPHEFFHCVIGPRGSEIKHIRGNYKVDVYMPNSESVSENVIVVGKQSQVDKAISYIQLLMDRDTEQRNKKYSDEYYG
ncbi:KH domain [Seminavis robusta]|uniref:KH domain n=1 Tax=Seminavis robusta TaxID=568900 RepID=A0A9N8EG41_9STRA|nr:KH domain [Seminavis robusta]|eukprot:Sro1044_g234910.1 KH domain (444) ;mRNA; r:17316-18726